LPSEGKTFSLIFPLTTFIGYLNFIPLSLYFL
jgi:hypothetical protein